MKTSNTKIDVTKGRDNFDANSIFFAQDVDAIKIGKGDVLLHDDVIVEGRKVEFNVLYKKSYDDSIFFAQDVDVIKIGRGDVLLHDDVIVEGWDGGMFINMQESVDDGRTKPPNPKPVKSQKPKKEANK